MPIPVVLASASPRRRELLTRIIPSFEIRPSHVEEVRKPGETPETFAVRAAADKALHVLSGVDRGLVIGVDTIVVLGDEVLGKPVSVPEAREMLHRLSGREHQVISGLVLVEKPSGRTVSAAASTNVRFKNLAREEIEAYVKSGEPLDKAGAYGIQGSGGLFVREISGCYYNVVGLPLNLLYETLQTFGLTPEG